MPIPSFYSRLVLLGALVLLLGGLGAAQAQSLRRMERQGINRTHITFVKGDTVQRFTITDARPSPILGRFYYWQGPSQILRTTGAYDGKLLNGPYQLTSRNGNLLVSGSFHKGLKTGLWRTWQPDGIPITSAHWRRGRQRGKAEMYDDKGQLIRVAKPTSSVAGGQRRARFWQLRYWRTRREQRRSRGAKPSTAPVAPAASTTSTVPIVPAAPVVATPPVAPVPTPPAPVAPTPPSP